MYLDNAMNKMENNKTKLKSHHEESTKCLNLCDLYQVHERDKAAVIRPHLEMNHVSEDHGGWMICI